MKQLAPADCTCGYPESIAPNGSLHMEYCPVYERWIAWVKLGGQSIIPGVVPVSLAPMYVVGVQDDRGCGWGMVGVFDTVEMADRCCIDGNYFYAEMGRNLMYPRELRPESELATDRSVFDHAGAMKPSLLRYPRRNEGPETD